MATPPKRGRGRPPLTEAEKKKREKRAQKAKEQAAAKREKEREKKKQQMLNKRKSIRSQVSKKVKEQQELAIEKSKMMNTGDLQSRIGYEEDKKVVGMIAAKYFGDLPSVDMNNPIEVQQRLDFFFDACIEARISPVVEWIALVLGIEWPSLRQIMTGKRRDDSLQQKYKRTIRRALVSTLFDFDFSDSVCFSMPRKALSATVTNFNLDAHVLSPIFLAAHPRHTANGHVAFLL